MVGAGCGSCRGDSPGRPAVPCRQAERGGTGEAVTRGRGERGGTGEVVTLQRDGRGSLQAVPHERDGPSAGNGRGSLQLEPCTGIWPASVPIVHRGRREENQALLALVRDLGSVLAVLEPPGTMRSIKHLWLDPALQKKVSRSSSHRSGAPYFDNAPSFYQLCWSHRSFVGSLIVHAHNSSSQFSC